MPNTAMDSLENYLWLARQAVVGGNIDYRRGYLRGLCRHYEGTQQAFDGEYAPLRRSRDAGDDREFQRGYSDGLAALPPQPDASMCHIDRRSASTGLERSPHRWPAGRTPPS